MNMIFQAGLPFAQSTNSAAATCSMALTASTRNILIESITTYSDLTNAVVTIAASGTTLWDMNLGSAGLTQHFPGLSIMNGNAQTLSALITGTASAHIALCGVYRPIAGL